MVGAARHSLKGQPWGLSFPLPPSFPPGNFPFSNLPLLLPGCRTKGARTINFVEFQQAMKEICVKRFKGKSPEEALQAVYGLIEGKEPSNVGTTVSRSFFDHCALELPWSPTSQGLYLCTGVSQSEPAPNSGLLSCRKLPK